MKIVPHWLKLDVNIFSNKKIKRLRKMPEGDSVFTLWIYMICEGMKNITNPGVLEIAPGIPMTDNDFADATDIKLDTVQMAITAFNELGMVFPNDKGCITVASFRDDQAIDRLEEKREQNRLRQQRHREKSKRKTIALNIKCTYCDNDATGYDHLIPLSNGGDDSQNNLVNCCKQCNEKKSTMDLTDFLNKNIASLPQRAFENLKIKQLVDFDGNNFITRYVTNSNAQSRVEQSRVEQSRYNDEYLRLANLLANRILQNDNNNSSLKANNKDITIKKWADDIRKLNELDNRSIADIENIINWCQNDNFWKSNVLSGSKLRKQFSQLYIKSKQSSPSKEQIKETYTDQELLTNIQTHGQAFLFPFRKHYGDDKAKKRLLQSKELINAVNKVGWS